MVLRCPEFDRSASLSRVIQFTASNIKLFDVSQLHPRERKSATPEAWGAFLKIIAPRNVEPPHHERAVKPLTAEGIGSEWAIGTV